MSFSIGFTFQLGECVDDYTWALKQFKEYNINPGVLVMDAEEALENASALVYPTTPTILCQWHVNQFVLKHCKPILKTDERWIEFDSLWRKIVAAKTIEHYEESWAQFQSKYSTGETGSCVAYLRNQWLKDGQRERLIIAWTSEYQHFGINVTSR